MRTNQACPEDRESAFSHWLRTGFWLPEQSVDPALEVKFNPYHDPRNGQFTFGPGGASSADMTRPPRRPQRKEDNGRWTGGFNGGGGGDFGGGGATGTYPWPRPASKSTMVPSPKMPAAKAADISRSLKVAQRASVERSTTINKNGDAFKLDSSRRPYHVRGS